MDFTKAEALIAAIEDESVRAAPSHIHLAILVGKFARELLRVLNTPEPIPPAALPPAPPQFETSGTTTSTQGIVSMTLNGNTLEPMVSEPMVDTAPGTVNDEQVRP